MPAWRRLESEGQLRSEARRPLTPAAPGLALGGFAGGHPAVKVFRFFLRYAQRLPLVAAEVFGEKHNLAGVMCVVPDLAIDGLHHRVRLSADRDRAAEVRVGQC